MIQRIQSVFLLLAAVLMAITYFCPLAGIVVSESSGLSITFSPSGIGTDFPTWGVITFTALCTLLPLINIFLYKKRKLQVNIALITILLIVLFYVTSGVYLNAFLGKLDSAYNIHMEYGIIFPVIALIFNILAILRIKKDEKLVKSLDRIR